MTPAPTFSEVAAAVAERLGRPVASLSPATPLLGELCRDSLDVYELYVVLDQWDSGFELPDQLDLRLATLGDAHHYLLTRRAHGPSRRSRPG